MYDINTKNVKKGRSMFLIFIVAGLFFLVIIGWVIISSYTKLNSLDSETTSTSVVVNTYYNDEGNIMYSPTYYYTVNGVEYSCPSDSSSSSNPGTENKTVYYDSKNPETCMTEYSKSSNKFLLVLLLLPIIFIVVGVVNIRKVNKRLKVIAELNQRGKLIKNLPYYLENSNISVNNTQIQKIVVDYTLPSGTVIKLYGDPRYDKKLADADGMVDLVIDEANPDNYFIDFDINRLSGNLESDYYNPNGNMVNNVNQNQVQYGFTQTNNINNNMNNMNNMNNGF